MIRRANTSGRQAISSMVLCWGDPFVHQSAGIGAGDTQIGGAQMPQPAKIPEARSPNPPGGGAISNGERASRVTTLPANLELDT